MFIIISTYEQINSVKLILKLLRLVSMSIHHLQGVYKLCQLKLWIIKMIKYNIVLCHIDIVFYCITFYHFNNS